MKDQAGLDQDIIDTYFIGLNFISLSSADIEHIVTRMQAVNDIFKLCGLIPDEAARRRSKIDKDQSESASIPFRDRRGSKVT